MSKAVLNTEEPGKIKNDEFQEILEMVRDMMGELHHTASTSVVLNEIEVKDEWAENIKEVLQKPVITNFQALKSIETSIIDMIQARFKEFARSKSDLIEKAVLVSKNSLHYAIVLKDDTIENEAEILEFKMDYDETPVANRFPLIISFPHLEHLEGANTAQEISLG